MRRRSLLLAATAALAVGLAPPALAQTGLTDDTYDTVGWDRTFVSPSSVLANDSGIPDSAEVALDGQPDFGSVTLRENGTFVLEVAEGYYGEIVFSYRAYVGGFDQHADIKVKVKPGCQGREATHHPASYWDADGITTGGPGDDVVAGGMSAVTLEGGDGNDLLCGGSGIQTLDGGTGNDTLDGGSYQTVFRGGDGSDTVSYAMRTQPVSASILEAPVSGEANEYDVISDDVEALRGGAAADELTGGPGRNTLFGGGGDDQLDGLGGDDRLVGGDGDDDMDGGGGRDLIDYKDRAENVEVTLGTQTGNGGDDEHDAIANAENLRGGSGPDVLRGTDEKNLLIGGDGADHLFGLGGDDRLRGEADADELLGQDGNDIVEGGSGTDALDGGDGGADLVDYAGRSANVSIDLLEGLQGGEEGEDDTLAGFESGRGGSGDDSFYGNDDVNAFFGGPGDDDLLGRAGDDVLRGGPGDDDLSGGADRDTLDGGLDDDYMYGGLGSDLVDYVTRTAGVQATLGDLSAASGDIATGEADTFLDVERLRGGSGDDRLSGGQSTDPVVIDGRAGQDVIRDGLGADTIYGGDAGDRIETRDDATHGDIVRCGGGWDRYDIDPTDVKRPDCETIFDSSQL